MSAGALRGKFVRSGAVQGLLAWIAYWLVESFVLHILPWLTHPSEEYMPAHAGFTALLLGIYAAVGLLTGWAAARVVALWSRRRPVANPAEMTGLIVTMFLCFLIALHAFLQPPWELRLW